MAPCLPANGLECCSLNGFVSDVMLYENSKLTYLTGSAVLTKLSKLDTYEIEIYFWIFGISTDFTSQAASQNSGVNTVVSQNRIS